MRPFSNIQPQTQSTIKTSKKLKTRLPPNTIDWYFHASSSVIPILLTAIAHGNTQQTLLTRDWYRYHLVLVESRIVASCVDSA